MLVHEYLKLLALKYQEDARRQRLDGGGRRAVCQQRNLAEVITIVESRHALNVPIVVRRADGHLAANDDVEAAAFVALRDDRAFRRNALGDEHIGDFL